MDELLRSFDTLRTLAFAAPAAALVVLVAVLGTVAVRARIREKRDAWLHGAK